MELFLLRTSEMSHTHQSPRHHPPPTYLDASRSTNSLSTVPCVNSCTIDTRPRLGRRSWGTDTLGSWSWSHRRCKGGLKNAE